MNRFFPNRATHSHGSTPRCGFVPGFPRGSQRMRHITHDPCNNDPFLSIFSSTSSFPLSPQSMANRSVSLPTGWVPPLSDQHPQRRFSVRRSVRERGHDHLHGLQLDVGITFCGDGIQLHPNTPWDINMHIGVVHWGVNVGILWQSHGSCLGIRTPQVLKPCRRLPIHGPLK